MFETAAVLIHDKLRWLTEVGGLARGLVSFGCVGVAILLGGCRAPAGELHTAPMRTSEALDWPALEARASRATGRAWTSPVAHYEVRDHELDARVELETQLIFDDEMVARAERELTLLGLAPRGIDLRATLREVESTSVLGFYSTLEDGLYVAPENVFEGEGTTVDGLAVHELVHALQARHSRLADATLGLEGHDDLSFALAAVMEGDALLAEAIDAEARGTGALPASRSEIEAAWDIAAYRAVFPAVPVILLDAWLLPYPLGLDLARRDYLAAQSRPVGTAPADRLMNDPPLSSEQLLAPEKWLDAARRDAPVFLGLPKVEADGCREFARNTFGVLGWSHFLRANLPGAVGAAAAEIERAVEGWGGDRYVLLECDGADRLAIAYVGDTESDAIELAAVLERALRSLASRVTDLPGELSVRRGGRRVQASVGFDRAARDLLWEATTQTRFANLDAFLAAHPEVFARAAQLRARAAERSGQQHDAGR